MSAVAPTSAIVSRRCTDVMPPSGTTIAPSASSPSLAAQNWTCGPKEKASAPRSLGPMPAAAKACSKAARHQAQSSAVSSTRSGRPVVPLVWCTCV